MIFIKKTVITYDALFGSPSFWYCKSGWHQTHIFKTKNLISSEKNAVYIPSGQIHRIHCGKWVYCTIYSSSSPKKMILVIVAVM